MTTNEELFYDPEDLPSSYDELQRLRREALEKGGRIRRRDDLSGLTEEQKKARRAERRKARRGERRSYLEEVGLMRPRRSDEQKKQERKDRARRRRAFLKEAVRSNPELARRFGINPEKYFDELAEEEVLGEPED